MKRTFYLFILVLIASMLAADAVAAQEAPYCVLRKPKLYAPPNCFEFYLADTRRTDAGLMAVTGLFGNCGVTDLAARQGWEVDEFYGGPYTQRQGTLAMNELSRFGGNFYGCQESDPSPSPQPSPQSAGWSGTWNLTSQWEQPNRGSYNSTLDVQISEWGGLTVRHGTNEIHNPMLNGNILTFQGNNGHHTYDVRLTRTGDEVYGTFRGRINATGVGISGTYRGSRGSRIP